MATSPETAIPLSGHDRTWLALPATEELRRDGVGLVVDDSEWEPISVPGHWRNTPAFATTDGPVLYRHHFRMEPPASNERRFIIFDGLFYQSDVWLDGAYLGDPEGYFFPHSFDVTALAQMSNDHVLAIEVACSPQRDKRAKRNLTGIFQHWDALDDTWNPGGIWRPVRVETTGPVRIETLRITCRDASDTRAHVLLSANLDTNFPAGNVRAITMRTLVDDVVAHERQHQLAKGTNEVTWSLDIDKPRLWWPKELGEQALTDVTVEVEIDGEVSHRVAKKTGLREIALGDWIFSVNGERLFIRGANHAPTRQALGDATPAELRRDVELALGAGLNMMRVHGHVTRPEFYEAADELGMLVWQDMPLQWGYARSVRRQAVKQATALVDHFGHHPSIAVWCGHNEPLALRIDHNSTNNVAKVATAYLAGQQLPTWNKTILDRWIKRSLETADSTRPVVAHSGVLPHLPLLEGTDSHLYFGWYHGNERDLPAFAARIPRMVRFVSEFGAQSVPDTTPYINESDWPHLDWELLSEKFGMQRAVFEKFVPPINYETFDAWRDATQEYQATVLRHHIATLRRLKYKPTGGFMLFSFADPAPRISWSVLDHRRAPKAAWQALIETCAPSIVVVDRIPADAAPGDTVELAVHVVNDQRVALTNAVASITVSGDEWSVTRTWTGDIAADDVVYVGTCEVTLPVTRETPRVTASLKYD